ncbi:hypothetical protein DPMN_004155 [Dreissena polymorpha]|uniref:Uncharacterized protein n=1 Tax=Dreissena polymorpha TaxID=45954 RepID=A0A9D4RVE1_DREPO|nr:hypothetical protein DPMN_004155 [Dreissena polymorpha]
MKHVESRGGTSSRPPLQHVCPGRGLASHKDEVGFGETKLLSYNLPITDRSLD